MPFLAVVWPFKSEVTSTKLSQMVENTRAHDHRADGTQGLPTPAAGFRSGAGTQSVPTATNTVLGLTGTPSHTDPEFSISGSEITVTRGGLYTINVGIVWSGNATGQRTLLVETYTGTAPAAGGGTPLRRVGQPAGVANTMAQSVSCDVVLPAGAKIRAIVVQNSGQALNIDNPTLAAALDIRWLR